MSTDTNRQASNQTPTTRFGLTDALLLSIAVIWGINVVIVKVALAELAPLPFNALRFTLAAGLSWALLRRQEPRSKLRREDYLAIGWLGLLGHTLYQVLFIIGINLSTAGNTSLLLATNPIWVAVLSGVFGFEKLRPRAWAGIFLSFSGIFLVTIGGGKEISFSGGTGLGDVMVLLGTLVFAVYTIKSKPYLSRYTPLQFSTYTMIAGALGLVLASIPALISQDWQQVSFAGWAGLGYSAIFAIVLGYYIWNNGVQKIGASRTAIYNNLSPVVAMLAGWIVLGEGISFAQLMGAGAIILGLYIARSSKLIKKSKQAQRTP